ncbi:MAG: ribonuclease III [Schwartzia sp.]|nr:ribonuclease III [Schwartzia sp. (in: firmicutes)]
MKFRERQKIAASVFETDESGRLIEKFADADPETLPPLVLAYIGDAVFHLYVRKRLLSYVQSPVDVVSQFGAKIVSAVCQARAYEKIEPMLTDEETAIFRRGRNAHSRMPRSATVQEYHASTGFEALLGVLYLRDEKDRLREILEAAFQAVAGELANSAGTKKIG